MPTLLVAATELRRRLRSRSAIVTAFVGPLALAIVFSLLVGGADQAAFSVGVADEDASATSTAIVGGLLEERPDGEEPVVFERVASADDARRLVDDGELDAAVVLPSGFEAGVRAGGSPSVLVVRRGERQVAGAVAEAVAISLVGGIERASLAVRAVAAATRAAPRDGLVEAARAQPAALVLADTSAGERDFDAAAFYGAAMSILFLFFTVGFAGRSILAERRDGTLARVLASPAPPGAVIAGKALAVGALGLTGFCTVWLVTSVAFGARWGNPVGVALLVVATTFAIAGIATFVGSLARTDQQADVYTSVVTFALALLGGNFVGPAAPDLLRTLSLATPNGWALRGFSDLAADASSPGSLALVVGILVAMGAVGGAIGGARFWRVVVQ